jgi:hypothetical protein
LFRAYARAFMGRPRAVRLSQKLDLRPRERLAIAVLLMLLVGWGLWPSTVLGAPPAAEPPTGGAATFGTSTGTSRHSPEPTLPRQPVAQVPSEGPGGLRGAASVEDGLVVASADDAYALAFRVLVRLRYGAELSGRDLEHSEFETSMIRPQLHLRFWEGRIDTFIQPELAVDAAHLLDASVDVRITDALRFRGGQFVTPFSRVFMTPVPLLLFPQFSFVDDAFRADRDKGVMAFGALWQGRCEYYVGVFNGSGLAAHPVKGQMPMWVGRWVWNPFGPLAYDDTLGNRPGPFRVALATNAYRQQRTTNDPNGFDLLRRRSVIGGDIAITVWRLHGIVEAFYGWQNLGGQRSRLRGGYAQAGWYVLPRLELAARVGRADLQREREEAYEGLLVYYAAGNHAKAMLSYGEHVHLRSGDGNDHRIQANLQLW